MYVEIQSANLSVKLLTFTHKKMLEHIQKSLHLGVIWPKVVFIFDACCVISIQCVKYSPLIEVHESSFPLITDMLNNTQTSHSIIIRVVVLEYRCTLNNIAYYQSQMCLLTFQLTTLWVQDFYFLVCKITHVSCINNVTTLKIN